MINRPLEDWEYPEPDEFEDEDDCETRACPSCGADVYEDVEQCPACGDYIVFSTGALSGWPWWFVALGMLGIVCLIFTLATL
jgi:hypothetical protein